MNGKYCDYLGIEIKQGLEKCIEKPQFESNYWIKPAVPIIEKVGKVNYGESNYGSGPLTKTIFVSDTFGNRYKISVEDLRQVKGHGFITYEEADKLDTHYDRDIRMHVVSTPEYNAWLTEAREKNFPNHHPQKRFNFDE